MIRSSPTRFQNVWSIRSSRLKLYSFIFLGLTGIIWQRGHPRGHFADQQECVRGQRHRLYQDNQTCGEGKLPHYRNWGHTFKAHPMPRSLPIRGKIEVDRQRVIRFWNLLGIRAGAVKTERGWCFLEADVFTRLMFSRIWASHDCYHNINLKASVLRLPHGCYYMQLIFSFQL